MMFVQDLKSEFYEQLINERVLLLCGGDVDALASCKILQYLFQCDHILYTLVSVTRKEDIADALDKHGGDETGCRFVVLLNCGGTFDVIEECKPKNDRLVFFIADAHRPFSIYNVYNNSQIRILSRLDSDENVPGFEDVFRDDMESDEDENEEGGFEAAMERRREKRQWVDNRQRLLFDYTQFNYFGKATALLMFELCWKMSRDSTEILWLAVVGLSDQLSHHSLESDRYVTECGLLQGHMSRHQQLYDQNAIGDQNGNGGNGIVNSVKMSFGRELNLAFLRHWTLLDSMRHSIAVACRFRLWTVKGQKKLHEFMAELGVPLSECRQKFASMDVTIRSSLKDWIFKLADKYQLDDIDFGCFSANLGYRYRFNAVDVANAVHSLIDEGDFFRALDALSWSRIDILEKGIELSKMKLMSIFQQVQTFLETRQIVSTGSYLYAVLQESTPNARIFGRPRALEELAYFLQAAYVSTSKSRKSAILPMVVAAPCSAPEHAGYSLVVGIPPKAETSARNLFAQVFIQAAIRCQDGENDRDATNEDGSSTQRPAAIVKSAYLQENVVLVQSEHSQKFFEAIFDLLC